MAHALLWFGGDSPRDDGGNGTAHHRRARILAAEDAVRDGVSSATNEEATLLAAIRASDSAAFRAVYLEHSTALWEFTAYLTRDPDAARDIVQDVFASLWERRATLEIREGFRVYLFRAVRNQVSKRHRHALVVHRMEAESSEEDIPIAMGSAATDPHMRLDAEALERAVDDLVRRMPHARRTAALLRLRHDLTDSETAVVMGISVDAVRMHVSRARVALRPLMERFREG